jgi:hypothetical protein
MNKYEAMRKLHPNIITIRGDIAYDENEQIVSYDEVAVQAVVDANAYKEARAKAYAPLAEQLDMQYWDAMNNTETWLDHIRSVKAAHPKEGE